MRSPLPLATALAALLLSASAAADVATPGWRKVPYSLAVEGMDRFPDRILLAFPWTDSGGAPTEEHAEITASGLSFGLRADHVKIWSARRVDYEAWRKTYTPVPGGREDKPLQELFASKMVVLCNLTPNHVDHVPEGAKVTAIREKMRAVSLTDTECTLEKVLETRDPSATIVTPENVPPRGGCASCSTGEHEGAAFAGVCGAVALLAGIALRRRRGKRV